MRKKGGKSDPKASGLSNGEDGAVFYGDDGDFGSKRFQAEDWLSEVVPTLRYSLTPRGRH